MESGHGLFGVIISGIVVVSLVYVVLLGNNKKNVGNLGQEVTLLPDSYREQLDAVFRSWELRLSRCLQAAQASGELAADADCEALASFFWIGWEGAVLRARLVRSDVPLEIFMQGFVRSLVR